MRNGQRLTSLGVILICVEPGFQAHFFHFGGCSPSPANINQLKMFGYEVLICTLEW